MGNPTDAAATFEFSSPESAEKFEQLFLEVQAASGAFTLPHPGALPTEFGIAEVSRDGDSVYLDLYSGNERNLLAQLRLAVEAARHAGGFKWADGHINQPEAFHYE